MSQIIVFMLNTIFFCFELYKQFCIQLFFFNNNPLHLGQCFYVIYKLSVKIETSFRALYATREKSALYATIEKSMVLDGCL